MKFLEYIINRLIDFRNKIARSRSDEYYEDWSILRGKSRKLSQEEVDLFI